MKKNFLLVAALASAATAEAADPKTAKIDSLQSVSLQEVQVVSTRAGKKTPMAFTNFSQKDIKGVNFGKDIPYLLSLTPSVTITSDAGNGIGYTTLRVRGTDPSRINITSNGIPMNDAESSSVFWVNLGDFASSVQSMQIQRGVGTSTNGAGAFGATVNMQTENIGTKPFAGIDVSGGSYYSHKETFRFGTGLLGEHWGFQGRLSNIGSKGYLDRASTKLNSYFLQGGYFSDKTAVKFVTFNGEEKTYHAWDYTSKYEQSLYGRSYNSCGEYYDTDGNVHYYDNQTDNYHQQHYQLIWSQIVNHLFSFNAALHYTRGDGYYEQYKSGQDYSEYGIGAEGTEGDLVRQKKMGNDFYGFIASMNYNNQQGLKATIGGGWNKYVGDHFGRIVWAQQMEMPDFEYYRNKAKKTDMNIYGKVSYDIIDGLNAFVDLQYRHVGYKMQDPTDSYGYNIDGKWVVNDTYNFFNPKAGLLFDIDNNNKVYASVAVAHREPTRNDYEDNLGTELKAERLIDWEAGYKYANSSFSAGANFYYMSYKDQFVLTGELNNIGEPIAKNAGKSYRMGLELEAAWRPIDWFRWDINATFSKNRAKDWTIEVEGQDTPVSLGDTRLSFSPDIIFNNIFTFSYKGLKASIQSQYIDDQYLTNTGIKEMESSDEKGNTTWETLLLKSHLITNLDLSYNFSLNKFGLKDATIGVTLYNLFSTEFDNNGWAAPSYKMDSNGNVVAYNPNPAWGGYRDMWAAGFAVSAPFNMMGHLSINF